MYFSWNVVCRKSLLHAAKKYRDMSVLMRRRRVYPTHREKVEKMVRKEAIIIAVVIAVLAAVCVPLSRQTSDAAKTGYKTKLEEKKIDAMVP